jgi:hypothetical protein
VVQVRISPETAEVPGRIAPTCEGVLLGIVPYSICLAFSHNRLSWGGEFVGVAAATPKPDYHLTPVPVAL